MSGPALPPGIAGAFTRELGRAREGRRAWPRAQLGILERTLAPHQSAIVAALAEAHGVRGKIAANGAVRFEITRDGRLQRGEFDPDSGLWMLGNTAGRGVLELSARVWSRPGDPVDAERAAERMAALIGRAALTSLAGG